MDGNVPFTLAECTGMKNKYPRNNHTLEVLWVSMYKQGDLEISHLVFSQTKKCCWIFQARLEGDWDSGRSPCPWQGGMRWALRSFHPKAVWNSRILELGNQDMCLSGAI